ncbi:MAG: UbiH/UbiF/VisC/COQ6 family ubiquinone biosynthesis hydroxylase [Gammaproteobacteria bacterium]
MKRYDVVVVGGGVVGAAAALALNREGFNVALIEKGKAPAPWKPEHHDARVYALSPGSARFLDACGVWSKIAAQRASPYTRMQVWEGTPAQSLTFDAAELAVPELGHIVEDSLLRATLWDALSGVDVMTGMQVTSIGHPRESGGPVTLKLDSRFRGNDSVEADLVIAAEGADSPLREAAGIDVGGWAYPQRSIVCNVATEKPHKGTAYQRFMPSGPLAFLPLADGRSSIVWSTDTSEADELMALPDARFRAELGEAFQQHLGAITAADKRFAFPLRLLHAQSYVAPGVALVGDAAHVIHPMAGQGLNLGLADVEALVAVLCEARKQKKPIGALRVLQRYERRRKAENVEALALVDGLHRLFRMRAPELGGLRELGMSLVGRAGMVKAALAKRAMRI